MQPNLWSWAQKWLKKNKPQPRTETQQPFPLTSYLLYSSSAMANSIDSQKISPGCLGSQHPVWKAGFTRPSWASPIGDFVGLIPRLASSSIDRPCKKSLGIVFSIFSNPLFLYPINGHGVRVILACGISQGRMCQLQGYWALSIYLLWFGFVSPPKSHVEL